MAFALAAHGFDDQATSGTSVSKGPLASTAGNLLLVFVRAKPTSLTVSTITDTAGDTFVSCGATTVDTSNFRTELFYAANCKGNASNTVTVTMSGTVTDLTVSILEYSGAATGTPFDKAITGSGASGTAWSTASLTPTNASELAVSFAVATTSFTGTAGTGYTVADHNNTTGNVWAEHILGTSAAQTGAWTSSVNQAWQVVQAFFSATNISAGITPQDFEQHAMGRYGARPWPLATHASVFAPSLTPALATAPPPAAPPKAVVLPDLFLRQAWNPERTHLWRAGWTQATWAIAPQKIPEPALPERYSFPAWNPEKSDFERPSSTRATWAVPPTKIPEPVLPERIVRPLWGPERSHSVGIPYLRPTWPTTTVVPESFARPPWNPEKTEIPRAGWTLALWAIPPTKVPDPLVPERFARPAWSPERSDLPRAAWTQALWAVPPTAIPEPTLPASFARSAWNPERADVFWNSNPVIVVFVPAWGYETLGPQRFLPAWNPERSHSVGIPYLPPTWPTTVVAPERFARTAWNPERTEAARAGWTQALWAIAPTKIPDPVLPENYARPIWNPERSYLFVRQFVAAGVAPAWGYELYGPQTFLRPPWNPERSHVARAGWTQATWAIPPQEIPEPVLPPTYARPLWSPERSVVLVPQRLVPLPLLSWTPALLDRYIQALRSNPWLDLFLPPFPQPNAAPLSSSRSLIVLVGVQASTAAGGQQDAIALLGQQGPPRLQGSQDAIVILGRKDTDPLSGSQ